MTTNTRVRPTQPEPTQITQDNFIRIITDLNDSFPYVAFKTLLSVVGQCETVAQVRQYLRDRPELAIAPQQERQQEQNKYDEDNAVGDNGEISWDDDALSGEEEEEENQMQEDREKPVTPQDITPALKQAKLQSTAIFTTRSKQSRAPAKEDCEDELFGCECSECKLVPLMEEGEDEFECAIMFVTQRCIEVPLSLIFQSLEYNNLNIRATFEELIEKGYKLKPGFPVHTKNTSPLRKNDATPISNANGVSSSPSTSTSKPSQSNAVPPTSTVTKLQIEEEEDSEGSEPDLFYSHNEEEDISWDDDALSDESEEEKEKEEVMKPQVQSKPVTSTPAKLPPKSTTSNSPRSTPVAQSKLTPVPTPAQAPKPQPAAQALSEIIQGRDEDISWDDDGYSGEDSDGNEIEWDDDAISDLESDTPSPKMKEAKTSAKTTEKSNPTADEIEWDDDSLSDSDSEEEIPTPSEEEQVSSIQNDEMGEIEWDDDCFDDGSDVSEDDNTEVKSYVRSQNSRSKSDPGAISSTKLKSQNSKAASCIKETMYPKIDPKVDFIIDLEIYDSLMDMFPVLTYNQVKTHFFNNQTDLFKARISLMKHSEKLKAQSAKAAKASPPVRTIQHSAVPKQALPTTVSMLSAFDQRIESIVDQYQEFPGNYIKQLLAENKYKFDDVERILKDDLKRLEKEEGNVEDVKKTKDVGITSGQQPALQAVDASDSTLMPNSPTSSAITATSMSIDEVASHPYFANALNTKEEEVENTVQDKDKFSDEFEFLTESFELLSFDTVKKVLLENQGQLLQSINSLLTLDSFERETRGLPAKKYVSAHVISSRFSQKSKANKQKKQIVKTAEVKKHTAVSNQTCTTTNAAASEAPKKATTAPKLTGIHALLKPGAASAIKQATKSTNRPTASKKSKKDPSSNTMDQMELQLKSNISKFILDESIEEFGKNVNMKTVGRMAHIAALRKARYEQDQQYKEEGSDHYEQSESPVNEHAKLDSPAKHPHVVKQPVLKQPVPAPAPKIKMKMLKREDSSSPVPTRSSATPNEDRRDAASTPAQYSLRQQQASSNKQSPVVIDRVTSAKLESSVKGKSISLKVNNANFQQVIGDMALRSKDGINHDDSRGTFDNTKKDKQIPLTSSSSASRHVVLNNGYQEEQYYDALEAQDGDDNYEEDWEQNFDDYEEDAYFYQIQQPMNSKLESFTNEVSRTHTPGSQFNLLSSSSANDPFGAQAFGSSFGQTSIPQVGAVGGSIWNNINQDQYSNKAFGFGDGAFGSTSSFDSSIKPNWSSQPPQTFGNVTQDSLVSSTDTTPNQNLFHQQPLHQQAQAPSLSAQLGSNNYQSFATGAGLVPGFSSLSGQSDSVVGVGGGSSFFQGLRSGSSVGLQPGQSAFGFGSTSSPFVTSTVFGQASPSPHVPQSTGSPVFTGCSGGGIFGQIPQSSTPPVNYARLNFDDSHHSPSAVSSLGQSCVTESPFGAALTSINSPFGQHATAEVTQPPHTAFSPVTTASNESVPTGSSFNQPSSATSAPDIEESIDVNLVHKVDSLFAMFPNIPKDQIEFTLVQNNEDMDKSVDVLVNYEELSKFNQEEEDEEGEVSKSKRSNILRAAAGSDEDDLDTLARQQEALLNQRQQERLEHLKFEEEERTRQAEERAYLARSQEAANKALQQSTEWDDHSANIQTITALTLLNQDEVEPYYYRNEYDINSTLVDIVNEYNNNLDSNLEKLKQKVINKSPLKSNSKVKIPSGGRVQNLPNFSITLKEKEILKHKMENSNGKLCYQYKEDGEDAANLRSLLESNTLLSAIFWDFYVKLLKYFAGDLFKILNYALYLVEHDGVSKTLEDSWKSSTGCSHSSSTSLSNATSLRSSKKNGYKDNKSPFITSSDLFKAPAVIKPTVTAASSAKLVKQLKSLEKGLDKSQVDLQRAQLKQVVSSSVIDLHRFIVPNAKITTEKVLKDWWAEEIKAREQRGILKAGSSVKYIEPLDIITGRGLHNAGYSKVKAAIGQLLKKENYVYEELVGRFRVSGYKGKAGF